jgi:hypothetical protein
MSVSGQVDGTDRITNTTAGPSIADLGTLPRAALSHPSGEQLRPKAGRSP